MKKFMRVYNELMSYLGVVCLAGFIISVLIQVVSRTFLPKTPSWTEEASRYLFIYMVAWGGSVAVHTKEYVGVDIFTSLLPPKLSRALSDIIINAGLMCFSGFILTQSVVDFAFIKYRMVSTAMQIPMQYVYFSIVVFFGLLMLSYALEIIYVLLYGGKDKEVKEGVA